MEEVQVSMTLPQTLWEQLLGRAQATKVDEAALVIRAVEQFLQQETANQALAERLAHECEELATMEFDDVGTEDEWLVVQNEALIGVEAGWG